MQHRESCACMGTSVRTWGLRRATGTPTSLFVFRDRSGCAGTKGRRRGRAGAAPPGSIARQKSRSSKRSQTVDTRRSRHTRTRASRVRITRDDCFSRCRLHHSNGVTLVSSATSLPVWRAPEDCVIGHAFQKDGCTESRHGRARPRAFRGPRVGVSAGRGGVARRFLAGPGYRGGLRGGRRCDVHALVEA